MEKFDVSGMSCASCSSRIEKCVSNLDGVDSCSVNLLTKTMIVEGTAKTEEIIKAVKKAGYGAKIFKEKSDDSENEILDIKKRLIFSAIFLIPLIAVSHFWKENLFFKEIVEILLSLCVLLINRNFFVNGFKAILNKAPNMDTLVSLGSFTAFFYSLVIFFVLKKNEGPFYFKSSAMILTLITVGKFLEAKSKGKTTNALKSLMKLSPQTALILRDGKEVFVNIEEISVNDIFLVKPGQSIPADGIVLEGESAVDESLLTGESIPCDKNEGAKVFAGTINLPGFLKCKTIKVREDTVLSKIIDMVDEASSTKAPAQKVADKVSGIFVPVVIIMALTTFIVWLLLGKTVDFSISRAISVLVISCPCALGLATPVAIMVGNGKAATFGILFKNSAALEETGKTEIVVLDKTGTITRGDCQVSGIIALNGNNEKSVLALASTLEKKSSHPLALAITKKAEEEKCEVFEAKEFACLPGCGVVGNVNGKNLLCAKFDYVNQIVQIDEEIRKKQEEFSVKGETPVFVVENNNIIGIISISDTIKEDSADAVREFKNLGLQVIMLTGDNLKTAEYIAQKTGLDNIAANVLPDQKAKIINYLRKNAKVCMIGDGINDAPALTSADTGIAIGCGTDIALDASDVVLIKGSLKDAALAIKISRETLKNIHENLFWAFFYNMIGIPFAAGAFSSFFGWNLNPVIAAFSMSLSSFCVITNALRLNFIKPDIKIRSKKSKIDSGFVKKLLEEYKNQMEKIMTVNVKGMMCAHCASHVKEALEKIDGVKNVSADFSTGIVELSTIKEISLEDIKTAVEKAGYNLA